MTQNKVMKLWTAIVTAFLALCTTLGLITTTAAAAVPQAIPARNTEATVTAPAASPWTLSFSRALPPTMKQRIRAEAHGSSPSCRHRAPAEEDATDTAALSEAEGLAEVEGPTGSEGLSDPTACSDPAALAATEAAPIAPLRAPMPLQR
ncbi:DUF6344 domain-containing protein [Streptomyces sp. NBC_01558]|uniref:DUF6344 domain-containing protein n=1 Tax=Streptomyces sp. NBC_01558 TaxID=2975878 RepID=UPI002DDB3B55|nr:DUF6344 domain-containing protein [Streptomyces sp. NBC_01558]WSD78673.1 DUF6344 domain-containing protein [Streptomyces sp. NBC_01558]